MNVETYLARIGADRPQAPDLTALAELQYRHLLAVPFENLSVVHGEPIVLDESQLYRKIVGQRRGGFCYELNGLFAWLLRSLGYRVDRVAAEVHDASAQRFGQPFDHLALIVHLARPYLVDVGFGESARSPLALPEGMVEDIGGVYRTRANGAGLLLEQQADGSWVPAYRFRPDPYDLADFVPMSVYHSTSPDSHFTRNLICSLAMPDGRVSLTADALIVTRHGIKTRTPAAPEEREALLRASFGIDLSLLPARVSSV